WAGVAAGPPHRRGSHPGCAGLGRARRVPPGTTKKAVGRGTGAVRVGECGVCRFQALICHVQPVFQVLVGLGAMGTCAVASCVCEAKTGVTAAARVRAWSWSAAASR